MRGWRHALFAEKAAVSACEYRIANYGSVGLKISLPSNTVVIVGNHFESPQDRQGFDVTGGPSVAEHNRIEKPPSDNDNKGDSDKVPLGK